jgi:hypothetical protein
MSFGVNVKSHGAPSVGMRVACARAYPRGNALRGLARAIMLNGRAEALPHAAVERSDREHALRTRGAHRLTEH